MGGRFLSHLDDALVIDVGGTTTDIALIEAGRVAVSEEGARVNEYKTSVRAADLLSIALGGDSHIRWASDKQLTIGPERVTPLAYLAQQHPRVATELRALASRTWSQATPDWLEYWFLLREPPARRPSSGHENRLLSLLRDCPLAVPEILRHLDLLHAGQAGAQDLFRHEIVGKAGLTSTDLMHIDGRYDIWDAGASNVAWKVFCQFQFRDPDEVRKQVWTQMSERIFHAVVTFLSGRRLELADRDRSLGGSDQDMGRWLFYNSLYGEHPHLETRIGLRKPIIGIGAPAGIFLPDVAEALHAELILPQHHDVANAVGAIAGSVMVEEEILVYPKLSRRGFEVLGYYVQAGDVRSEFEDLADAIRNARSLGEERAWGAAIRSGAENPTVSVDQLDDGLDTYRIRAKAIGNPRLAR
jgi:hypothetical protein